MSDQPYVLIADDDPLMLRSLQIILRNGGFRVVPVGDGVSALEQMRREKPALALLDVMMARMNGLEVCRTVKSDPAFSGVTVFLLTARAMPRERQQGLDAGADEYITKPFANADLLARVRTVLGLPATPPAPSVKPVA